MLDVINGFANGWVATPVISAFARHGVFEVMSSRPMTLKKLASRCRGNVGHLHAALRLLYELGWIEWVEPDRYEAAKGAVLARQLPNDLADLIYLSMAHALEAEQFERLLHWLERCGAGWAGADPAVVSVLDGALLAPLLAKLSTLGSSVLEQAQPNTLSIAALQAIQALFVQRGWGQVGVAGFRLTPSGRALLASSGALGTVVSYATMFRGIDDLLFGKAEVVFGADAQGHELHVDRTLNVTASGVQHQSHFAELDALILRIFDQYPLATQPRYVADMGCGDGSLLHRIYELIKTRSARGQALAEYPLTLIGADYNVLALESTGKTLAGLPHVLVRGDIADPQQWMVDLAAAGITDPENILHVRSFLDHDRPFLPLEDKRVARRREGLNGTGVYVSREGDEIKAAYAVQGLVEHLHRWRRVIARFGLLLLEVHCLQPATVKRLGNLTESAHFDAYHAFSGQQLVEAPIFLAAAAEAGLFPEEGISQAIPKQMDFTRISLHRLVPQPYTVRHPVRADLRRLKQLDRICQPKALHTPPAEIERRVCGLAQEQWVLEFDGQIVAVLYTQRIESIKALRGACYKDMACLHRPEGRCVQLLGLFVAPEMQGRGFSDALIGLMLAYSTTLDGVDAVVGVTRCANFMRRQEMCSFYDYIQSRNEQGQLIDPILHFHTSHGAAMREVLQGFRPQDTDNEGAGILIEYQLRSGGTAVAETEVPSALVELVTLTADQIESAVSSTVMQVLGSQRAAAYGIQVPLMEMGLSSLELLELRMLLSTRLGESLPSTFLFSYGMPEAIIGYFMAKSTVQTSAASTLSTLAPAVSVPQDHDTGWDCRRSDEAIAIIGMACRLPRNVNNPAQFWQELFEARDAVGPLPANRQRLWGNGMSPCRWQAGFLDEIDYFDAEFFRISPREAELLDPQQRLLLEVAWEAVESAAIAPATLRGTRSGVFVGMMGSDYEDVIARQGSDTDFNAHFATGSACSVAAGRLSYFFDWQGPALSIDTACSSSLVAVHTACHSLLRGECNLVLAAGVNLLLNEKRFLAYEQAGMLSPHRRCRTFDASADGYVRGEGCAAVILKRLSDAQADRDPIMAVIRGSAINQDGSSSGLTAPNQLAQQAVIEAALTQAGVAPKEIGYLEAHGTGTKLGDPIEVMAAAQVLGAGRSADQPLLIGSLKSAIGHLEAAAGIAGLIKTVLSMQHGVIPAQLHFETPNPHIPWNGLSVRIVTQAQAWPAGLKRAGISSFGFSGTNAHIIVEEYVEPQRAPTVESGPVVVVLSAKSEKRLRDQAQQLLTYLECHDEVNLADLAYTLQVGREALGVRLALVARFINELKERLSHYAQGETPQEDTYQGELKRGQETLALRRADADMQRTVEVWVAKGELGKLAQLWVQGLEVEWGQLYGQTKPQRISLPTYPFAKERYWVPQKVVQGGLERQLHPLVHRNTSDLSEQRFSTTLTGEEFFLCDHVVQGERVVPGAAQLEWARAAVALASGGEVGMAGLSVLLQEVTWLRPLVVTQPQDVHIGLEMQEDGRIGFEIYSGSGEESVVYSQGWAQLVDVGEAPRVDLEAVRGQCERTLTGEACYARFAQLGLGYGSSFQVLHELRLGDNVAVGTLRLSGEGPVGYAWAPNMLDGALQTSIGLAQDKIDAPLALPFTVAQVRQWDEMPTPAWAVVRSGADDSTAVRKLDIEIVDKTGQVTLRLSGFSTRPFLNTVAGEAALTASVASAEELPQTLDQVLPVVTTQDQINFGSQRAGTLVSHAHLASRVRQGVRQSIVQTLKLDEDQLEEDLAFAEYGVDSITGVALVNAINTQLGLNLPITALFDYVTIEQLSAHIIVVHRERLSMDSAVITEARPSSTFLIPPSPIGLRRRQRFQAPAPLLPRDAERTSPTYHRLLLMRPGTIEDLRMVEDVVAPLGEHDVRIEVRAFSLNFDDLLCVKGLHPTQPPYPFTPGFEASGVVAAVGRNVTRIAVGDAVIALTGEALGAHASALTCPQSQVFPCPAGLSFEAACALPAVVTTMIECFKKVQLKVGQHILIQTAAGGTGLIAVQLAQHAGAEIYATAGSQAKLDYLASLGVPHRINYLEEDFEMAIARLTNGRGVDVVINTLAGDALQKGLNCLAPGGHYIEIAMTSLKSARTIDLSGLSDNQTFHSVDLRKLGRSQPVVMQTAMQELARLLEQGVIHPTLSQVFTFEKVQDAYRWLENRQNIGKVVVSIPEAYRFRAREILASKAEQEPIAVIGMSGRFACMDNLQALWTALAEGKDLTQEVTRWDLSRYYQQSTSYCRHGGFLQDIDCFDPLFFNISGLEATYMDPQQRLFLEEAWRALEDAGYVGAGIAGQRCGVYVGCASGDYQNLLDSTAPAQAFWGNAGSVIPARIAYYLDLQGPAVATDTACSSSLVALHQACQGLRAGETELALAGGVFVQSTESFYLKANRAGMLSPTGHCYTFDARADGFVPGEGVGVVVLKRLSQAQADGDHIYGVILGSGVNQDGATNGITAPSAASQERLEREVYQRFGIEPSTIQLVEAHGTGTVLGDPIEFQALTQAFRGSACPQTCALGSIKSNLGHTATAAGIAGVIKILLALQHRQIPPSLHFVQSNPHIDFEHSPFYVNTKLKDWEAPAGTERRAAVSSFGFSGTNAHAVIGEAPTQAISMQQQPRYLIVLSAHTPEQLRVQAEQLVAHCQRNAVEVGAMSYTLSMGRRHFNHRLACVVQDSVQVVEKLTRWLALGKVPGVVEGCVKALQREQTVLERLGHQCLEAYGRAKSDQDAEESLAAVAELYALGVPLMLKQLYLETKPRRISLPTYPFARERYWAPAAAPTVAMPTVVTQRGLERPLNPLTPTVPPADFDAQLREKATIKFRQQVATILKVPASKIEVAEPLARYGVDSILVVQLAHEWRKTFENISTTLLFEHSSIEALVAHLMATQRKALIGWVELEDRVKVTPTVATPAVAKQPGSEYPLHPLVHRNTSTSSEQSYSTMLTSDMQLREKATIKFKQQVATTLKMPALKIEVTEPLARYGVDSILVVQLAHEWRKTFDNISTTLLFEHSSIEALVAHLMATQREALMRWVELEDRVKVTSTMATPTVATSTVLAQLGLERPLHPLVHRNTSTQSKQRYNTTLTGEEQFLRDHVVCGELVLPGVAHLEWARAAVVLASGDPVGQTVLLKDVTWLRPLRVSEPLEVHISLEMQDDGWISFEIYSDNGDDVLVYSQGQAQLAEAGEVPQMDLEAARGQCDQTLMGEAFYAQLPQRGVSLGPYYQVLSELRIGTNVVVGSLRVLGDAPVGYGWPPNLVDGALQTCVGLVPDETVRLPFAMAQVQQWGELPTEAWSVMRPGVGDSTVVRTFDVDIVDRTGRVALRLSGFSPLPPHRGTNTLQAVTVLPDPARVGELTLTPLWEAVQEMDDAWPTAGQRVALVGATGPEIAMWQEHFPQAQRFALTESDSLEKLFEWLHSNAPLEHLVWWVPSSDVLTMRIGFRLIKALLALEYGSRALGLTVVTRQAQAVWPGEAIDATAAGIHGLIGSLAKEYAHWRVRLLDVPAHEDPPLAWLLGQLADSRGGARAYRHGQGYRQRLVPCTLPAAMESAYRTGGVYVVLGGAGGLGVALSEYLIRHYRAQVVWLGRRAPDDTIEQQCARLGALGPTPLYLQADATNRDSLELAHKVIRQRFGAIHGVVHAAIVLADRSLAQMDEATFEAAWSAKVATTEHLCEVFSQEPLDWLVFFSSVQSFMKAPGQSNYAAGCCFADAFAQGMRDRPYPVKVMHWGYWGSVGVVASASYRERMAQMGIGSIESPEAMEVLEQLLAGPLNTLAFVKTTQTAVADALLGVARNETAMAALVAPAVELPQTLGQELPVVMAQDQIDFDVQLAPLLLAQLKAVGWLAKDAHPSAPYARWREHSLRLLEARGLLSQASADPAELWVQWEAYYNAVHNDPALRARVCLVDTTLRALPAVLRGDQKATEVLFPQGQLHLVEGVYRDHPVADYFNAVLVERLVECVRARLHADPKTKLRIVEIGAGTGGTSALVFEQLAAYALQIEEYAYTDLSPVFLLHAQEHYAAPYLQTKRLDIERAPSEQGFEVGRYDIVIAANVLHATRDIRHTVRHVKALLKGNGLLLLNELTDMGLFAHLTFGLLEGWWLAEDCELRMEGTPGLMPQTWQQVLEAEGFGTVRFPAEAAHGLGQQIVEAFSDGVVWKSGESEHVGESSTSIDAKLVA